MKNIRYWGNQAVPGGLKRGRNGAKMLIIDNFTTVMPYIRCKLNKIVTYRHYRYTYILVVRGACVHVHVRVHVRVCICICACACMYMYMCMCM